MRMCWALLASFSFCFLPPAPLRATRKSLGGSPGSSHRHDTGSISPGNIWTPMWQKIASEADDPQAKIQEGIDAQPLGRLGTPAEIALAALFLASDATFCTGTDLLVTGGAELGYGKKNRHDMAKDVKE